MIDVREITGREATRELPLIDARTGTEADSLCKVTGETHRVIEDVNGYRCADCECEPGDRDRTPHQGDVCGETRDGWCCTRFPHPVEVMHAAGTGRIIAAMWDEQGLIEAEVWA